MINEVNKETDWRLIRKTYWLHITVLGHLGKNVRGMGQTNCLVIFKCAKKRVAQDELSIDNQIAIINDKVRSEECEEKCTYSDAFLM